MLDYNDRGWGLFASGLYNQNPSIIHQRFHNSVGQSVMPTTITSSGTNVSFFAPYPFTLNGVILPLLFL